MLTDKMEYQSTINRIQKICFKVSETQKKKKQNKFKRNILKIGGMFFDPYGFLSPLTLKAKLFFQVCSFKLDWDFEVKDQELVHRWNSFLGELKSLNLLDVRLLLEF